MPHSKCFECGILRLGLQQFEYWHPQAEPLPAWMHVTTLGHFWKSWFKQFRIPYVLGMMVSVPVAIAVCVPLGILAVLISSTADAIFKAYLYSFATGKTLSGNVDTSAMRDAFSQR